MKMCPKHQDELKEALSERGLGRFISSSMEEAVRNATTTGFEPIVQATSAIVINAYENIGDEILMADEACVDQLCPMCFVLARPTGPNYSAWIDHAADDQLSEAIAKGLIAKE